MNRYTLRLKKFKSFEPKSDFGSKLSNFFLEHVFFLEKKTELSKISLKSYPSKNLSIFKLLL